MIRQQLIIFILDWSNQLTFKKMKWNVRKNHNSPKSLNIQFTIKEQNQQMIIWAVWSECLALFLKKKTNWQLIDYQNSNFLQSTNRSTKYSSLNNLSTCLHLFLEMCFKYLCFKINRHIPLQWNIHMRAVSSRKYS